MIEVVHGGGYYSFRVQVQCAPTWCVQCRPDVLPCLRPIANDNMVTRRRLQGCGQGGDSSKAVCGGGGRSRQMLLNNSTEKRNARKALGDHLEKSKNNEAVEAVDTARKVVAEGLTLHQATFR